MAQPTTQSAASAPRLIRRSSTTTTTEPLLMLLKWPESPTTAGVSAWRLGILTTTDGPTSSLLIMERIGSTTTITTARSLTWQSKPASHSATGRTGPPGATTTATDFSICLFPATYTTT